MVVLGRWNYRPDRIPSRLVRTSDEQRLSTADNFESDLRDLIGCLAKTQDDLGKTLTHGSMVIDLGKPKILKGLFAQRGANLRMSRLEGGSPFAKIRQKSYQVHFVIKLSVSKSTSLVSEIVVI